MGVKKNHRKWLFLDTLLPSKCHRTRAQRRQLLIPWLRAALVLTETAWSAFRILKPGWGRGGGWAKKMTGLAPGTQSQIAAQFRSSLKYCRLSGSPLCIWYLVILPVYHFQPGSMENTWRIISVMKFILEIYSGGLGWRALFISIHLGSGIKMEVL